MHERDGKTELHPSQSWVALRRKIHFAHNILKSWVSAQGVEDMVNREKK